MAKKPTPQDFESTLKELETIVTHLESGELPLEDALNEFEAAIKLVQQGQERLLNAEQRIQILLSKSETDELEEYSAQQARSKTDVSDIPF